MHAPGTYCLERSRHAEVQLPKILLKNALCDRIKDQVGSIKINDPAGKDGQNPEQTTLHSGQHVSAVADQICCSNEAHCIDYEY